MADVDAESLGIFESKCWYEVALARGANINECHCFSKEWIECQGSGTINSLWECVISKHTDITDSYILQGAFTVMNTSSDARRNAVAAPFNMPLRVIRNNMSIWFLMQTFERKQQPEQISRPKRNAFELLMTPKAVKLSKKETHNNKQIMYNDIVDLFVSRVSQQALRKVEDLIECVTECMWEIDGNGNKFFNASINGHCPALPSYFEKIYNRSYRNWQAQKKAKPRLNQEALQNVSGKLFEKLIFWDSSQEKIDRDFMNASRKLAECLHKYSEYLCKTKGQVNKSMEKIDNFFNENENIGNPISAITENKLETKYSNLNYIIEEKEAYEPIYVDLLENNVPEDRRRRYEWFQSLKLCHRIQIYRYNCGGGYGNMTFVWKVGDVVDQNRIISTIDTVRKMVPRFETKAMANEMRSKYTKISGLKPTVRRSLVQYLTGKIPRKSDVDDLFELYTAMPLDEEDEIGFLYDERNSNQGRPAGNFDAFYTELDRLLEEFGKAAEERRKSLTAHLPIAVSIADLIRQVKERLDEGTPIPSETTLRYQFMPPFENRNSITRYKGKFDIVSKIQRRQIRKYHVDAHYVNSYFINLKSWCVVNRENSILICMDDKAKIPIGEPGTPEASTSHNRRALTKSTITLEASDHNYHMANLTPSVNLFVEIPDDASKSFFAGNIFVGLKDSIFEGSDPLRHVVELFGTIRSQLEDQLPPYLSLFSDGGGDHNIKFIFVKCALLALFKIGDFDVLNAGRCAPNQSYINPAERCMSLLNIGLQGMALERDHAGPFEATIKSCKSMKGVRIKSNQQQGLKEAYRSAVETPRKFVEKSFASLQLKGKPVQIFQPDRECSKFVEEISKIEPTITEESEIPHLRTKLSNFPTLEKYLSNHLSDDLYLLQFRKCDDAACCTKRNGELPPKVPAPVLGPGGEHYLPFDQLYGKVETTEKDRPSLNLNVAQNKTKNEAGFKYLASRVVGTLSCHQCDKPRCVFSMTSTITPRATQELEDIIFTCGMQPRTSSLYTSRFLECASPVENAFYLSRTRSQFVCVHCGIKDFNGKKMATALESFKTVFPCCSICVSSGKSEVCLHPRQGKKPSDPSEAPSKAKKQSTNIAVAAFFKKRQGNASKQTSPSKSDASSTAVSDDASKSKAVQPEKVHIAIDVNRNGNDQDFDVKFNVDYSATKQPMKDSNEAEPTGKKEHDDSRCTICKEEDPPGGIRSAVNWIDCDVCKRWAHLTCAYKCWKKLRKGVWVCAEDKSKL